MIHKIRNAKEIFKKKIEFKLIGIKNYNFMDSVTDTVVLVRLDAIGDFIMSYSVFCEYRKFFQGKKIILICTNICESLAKAWKIADEVLAVNMNQYSTVKDYRDRINTTLLTLYADIVVQMASYRMIEVECIVGLIHSKNKVAFKRDDDNEKLLLRRDWNKVYSILLPYDKSNFEIRRNFYLLNTIIKADIIPYQALLPKTDWSFNDEEEYFVVAPGGSYRAKKWDNEKYACVVNYILEKKHIKCYMLGSTSDSKDNDLIQQKILFGDGVIDFTGKITILESIEIVRRAKFIITNDTCFVHIAAATNTKSVCIAGGWEWGRFVPYNLDKTSKINSYPLVVYHKTECYNCNFQNKDCEKLKNEVDTEKKLPCIGNVSVESVLKMVDQCLLYQ